MITVLIVIIFFIAVLAWARANAHIAQSGTPGGRIVIQDTDRRRPVARPVVSRRYGLILKPDYLVETPNGLIPVEVKSRPCPSTGPRAADVMQLMTYCVLVEDKFGRRPPHGIIAYADRHELVPYTPQHRETLLNIVTEIAAAEGCAPHRNNRQHARCKRCGYQPVCDEAV
jgi:CRISPR-associated exonuclease Cas4